MSQTESLKEGRKHFEKKKKKGKRKHSELDYCFFLWATKMTEQEDPELTSQKHTKLTTIFSTTIHEKDWKLPENVWN